MLRTKIDGDGNQEFTPIFSQIKSSCPIAEEKSIFPKFVFLAGGLAGSGKTSHLLPLINFLTEKLGLSVDYLDKDVIGRGMPDAVSAQVYHSMIERGAISDKDVVIYEGNIIGNLSLFRDYIISQHALGTKVVCLDFQCSDAKIQHERLVERSDIDPEAKKRDSKKLDFYYYISIDRPGEILRHDKQIRLNQDLIDASVLDIKIIETSMTSIQENVSSIVEYMNEQNCSAGKNRSKIQI